MLTPSSKSEATRKSASGNRPSSGEGAMPARADGKQSASYALMERPTTLPGADCDQGSAQRNDRRSGQRKRFKSGMVKLLDSRYWQRLLRYFYLRFLRMQGSPEAIARGVAAGVFAGSFPLLGFQTIIGVAIAATVRGNKVMAAVSTWISNPFTYLPIFALNFQVGRLLMGLPNTTVIPASPAGLSEWMSLGMTVTSALMLGSLVVGAVLSVLGYYVGLVLARRVRAAKQQ
ncbi:MAG: DUF2062 domain-containing protein [Cyanobacteria bacterium J06623_4]